MRCLVTLTINTLLELFKLWRVLMLRKIFQKLQNITSNKSFETNQLQFEAPQVTKIDWRPLNRNGSNFCTHRLVEVATDRVEFRATQGVKLVSLLFVGAGIISLIILQQSGHLSREFLINGEHFIRFFPVSMGLLFLIVGCCTFYFGTTPIVFDKQIGYFWKCRSEIFIEAVAKNYVRLEKIRALQLLSKYFRDSDGSYYSYELNLVLDNGDRMNVVVHGDSDQLREDAGVLATFLGVPVWDGIINH